MRERAGGAMRVAISEPICIWIKGAMVFNIILSTARLRPKSGPELMLANPVISKPWSANSGFQNPLLTILDINDLN